MSNYRKLKKIVILLGVIFVLNLVIIATQFRALNLWSVSAVVVQVILVIYLVLIPVLLIKEIEKLEKKNKGEK